MQKVTDKKTDANHNNRFSGRKVHLYACASVIFFFAGVDMSNVGFNQESVNLGMICARHTTNRQCFKKVTCPFNWTGSPSWRLCIYRSKKPWFSSYFGTILFLQAWSVRACAAAARHGDLQEAAPVLRLQRHRRRRTRRRGALQGEHTPHKQTHTLTHKDTLRNSDRLHIKIHN